MFNGCQFRLLFGALALRLRAEACGYALRASYVAATVIEKPTINSAFSYML
jgi:hypothetical protein